VGFRNAANTRIIASGAANPDGSTLLKVTQGWQRLSLEWRFNLASLLILLLSGMLLGWWVGEAIKAGVVHRSAAATALYVENFIVTELQELSEKNWLSDDHVTKLEQLLASTPLGREIVAIRIWGPGGRIVYGTGAGETFPLKDEQARAWQGEIVSHVSNLTDEENAEQRRTFRQLLETYTPIRLEGSDRVIAVAEFYGSVAALNREVRVAQSRSWLIVSSIILLIYLLLVGLVRQGSRTITRQATELHQRLAELDKLLTQNQTLSERVTRAASRTTALNERFLRRISAELHDGPAQDLSYALLKFDAIASKVPDEPALQGIETSLQRATQEIRNIARGLRLPELEPLTLREVAIKAVREHERRSAQRVAFRLGDLPHTVSLPIKITVYRLIQEALNNAYKHGGSSVQHVELTKRGDALYLVVADNGQGFALDEILSETHGLGLLGMRERVESLGGSFRIETQDGSGAKISGTKIYVQLPLEPS
jgi:signal transduction histidine kinase